jgi:hypothetical protein
MVRYGSIVAVALLLPAATGCGDGADAPRASRTPAATATATPAAARAAGPTSSKAPVLVFFQRQGAGGATLDTFTVRRDGSGRLEKRYGGAGGRFEDLELRAGVLPRLKSALARLPRSGSSLTEGSPPPGGAQYLLRYRGRTLTARAGGVVVEARPAVRILDGLIDGIGVRRVTRENATGRP